MGNSFASHFATAFATVVLGLQLQLHIFDAKLMQLVVVLTYRHWYYAAEQQKMAPLTGTLISPELGH